MTNKKITKDKWLELNGFSCHGKTYIVMGNSFAIKDALKTAGFKFSPLLRWHGTSNEFPLPDNCSYFEIDYNDYFVWQEEEGVSFLKESSRERLESLFNPPRESKSTHIGEVGGKLENIRCEVTNVGGYNTAYGYKWVYTFTDKDENEYTWFTTVNKSLSVGMFIELSGKVKEHSEYKGVKTTVLTRCKITNIF